MIRLATLDDIHDIDALITEFINQAPRCFEDYSLETIAKFILSDDSIVVVAELDKRVIGLIIGIVNEHPLFGYTVSTELCWYITPKHRGGKTAMKLLKTFIDWSKYKKAKYSVTAEICKVGDLSKMYSKLGFEPLEKTYFMGL